MLSEEAGGRLSHVRMRPGAGRPDSFMEAVGGGVVFSSFPGMLR